MRSRDQLESVVVPAIATGGTLAPFFSPDGLWIAFSDGQMLMKVQVSGGPAVQIAESGPAAFGSWSSEGIVVASMNGLFRVASQGGGLQRLETGLGANEQAMYPQLLPGGRAILFTVIPTRSNTPKLLGNTVGARVDLLDLASGIRRTLIPSGGRAQYVPTGHLVYVAGGSLYAAAFDLKRLELRGAPVPMVTEADMSEFAISDDGTLAYQPGSGPPRNVLVWVDRQGHEEPLEAPPRDYVYPRLSPDGARIALDTSDAQDRDIWIWDLRRKTLERFTIDPTGNPLVAWSRDGRSLAFGSGRFGVSNLFHQSQMEAVNRNAC